MSEWSLTKTGKTTLSTYMNQKLWVLALPRRSFDKKTRKIKKKINGALRIFAPPATLNEEILDQFRHAPGPRQLDIYRFLVSSALDVKLPDVVRQNCYSALHTLKDLTQNHILIASAREFVERIGKRGPTLIEARVAFASGLLPYLKQAQLRDLYGSYLAEMKKIGASWGNYNSHGELLRNLEEIGGLDYCPDDCIDQFVEWLVLCYIGEQGGRTSWGNIHNVYYSNVGAPISLRILTNTSRQVSSKIARLEKKSKKVKILIQDEHVARRFHAILDLVED